MRSAWPSLCGAPAIAPIGIELRAVVAKGRDLAVGEVQAGTRVVLLAAPDGHILLDVVPLLRREERRQRPDRRDT